MQTQTSNTLHNAIMEAGSQDRLPVLAPDNYVQWKSIIKRYIDTNPNHELIHYCLKNPPYELGWIDKEIPISEGSPITRIERFQETYKNVSQDIRDQLNAEAEADGESLESYYLRFYKMMNELIRNQCKVINHQVNVQFLLQLRPEWQRFVTLVKQNQELKTVLYHKLYDILKQHQHEVNEIRAERIAQQAATRNKGKAIVHSLQPIYDQEPSMVTEDDETSKDKEIDKLMALISLSFFYDEVTNLQCDYLELLEKCKRLETELSKSKMMSKSFESVQKHAINIELKLQQCKEKIKNDKLFKVNQTKEFCKEHEQYFKIQDLKAQLQDKDIVIRIYKLHTDHNQAKTSQLPQDSRKTNKRVSFSTGVIPTISVSRPQLKSNLMGDRVMRNNSQGKKHDVEDQRRNVKLSKNKTSVTACNESLNAKAMNVNSVCATCDECVLNDKHNMCVLKSVEKSLKKTVASESKQKPRNITRKLYERVSKTCSWWYPKFTPSRYKWKPKSENKHVNPNVSMPLGNASRTANVMNPMTSRRSTVSNTPLSSNSFVARTVKFGNDQIAPILGFRNLVQRAVTIKRVYYVEGLNLILFFVGQLCDADLEVAFRKSTCYIRDLKGNDLLTGSRGTYLYSITLQDTYCPNPICLMAKATSS
nr:integrase, catalytic region, zinc finger, CCHC-type, peptidase aspartic, catalytic [Tanacetum cinerariifolium]